MVWWKTAEKNGLVVLIAAAAITLSDKIIMFVIIFQSFLPKSTDSSA